MQENMDMNAILSYVEEHLDEDISLDRLSEEFHYSKFYISRAFTQAYGKSFYQYVKERRLTMAAQALVETEKPIIQIAYEAHYNSQQAFTLAFHQVYVSTPQEYRRNGVFRPKQSKITTLESRKNIMCTFMLGGMAA